MRLLLREVLVYWCTYRMLTDVMNGVCFALGEGWARACFLCYVLDPTTVLCICFTSWLGD